MYNSDKNIFDEDIKGNTYKKQELTYPRVCPGSSSEGDNIQSAYTYSPYIIAILFDVLGRYLFYYGEQSPRLAKINDSITNIENKIDELDRPDSDNKPLSCISNIKNFEFELNKLNSESKLICIKLLKEIKRIKKSKIIHKVEEIKNLDKDEEFASCRVKAEIFKSIQFNITKCNEFIFKMIDGEPSIRTVLENSFREIARAAEERSDAADQKVKDILAEQEAIKDKVKDTLVDEEAEAIQKRLDEANIEKGAAQTEKHAAEEANLSNVDSEIKKTEINTNQDDIVTDYMQNLDNYLAKFKIYLKYLREVDQKLRPQFDKIKSDDPKMIKILPNSVTSHTGLELLLALLMKALTDGNSDFVDKLYEGLTSDGKTLELIKEYEDKQNTLLDNINCEKRNDQQICKDVKLAKLAKLDESQENCCSNQVEKVKPEKVKLEKSDVKESSFGKIEKRVAQAMGIAAARKI